RLLAGQAPGHVERVGVRHRDDLVGHRAVVGVRPEVLADALHQVGPPAAARVHRAFRVGADDLDPAAGYLLEVAARAGDRPAGADAGDEMSDLAVGIGPDLRPGGCVVAGRSLRVGVLVWLPGPV